jgi:hypothetical protein
MSSISVWDTSRLTTAYIDMNIMHLLKNKVTCFGFILTKPGYSFKPIIRKIKKKCIGKKYNDKSNIMGLRSAWFHTSLRIRAVWSESMLFAISFSTCYRVCKRTAWILIRLRGCVGWSGSMLVANPLCWFCRDAAHFLFKLVTELIKSQFKFCRRKKNSFLSLGNS